MPQFPLSAPNETDEHVTARGGARHSSWRQAQADHNERMARLSDAYAAAYEGDVQYADGAGQRTYLIRQARTHRKDAESRRAAAERLRSSL